MLSYRVYLSLICSIFTGILFAQGSGNCLRFDGQDDYVEVSNSPELNLTNEVSIEVWVRPDLNSLDEKPFFVCRYNTALDEVYKLGINSTNAVEVRLNGPEMILISPSNVVVEEVWSHIAMTYDGQVVRIYVNGVLIDSGFFFTNFIFNSYR